MLVAFEVRFSFNSYAKGWYEDSRRIIPQLKLCSSSNFRTVRYLVLLPCARTGLLRVPLRTLALMYHSIIRTNPQSVPVPKPIIPYYPKLFLVLSLAFLYGWEKYIVKIQNEQAEDLPRAQPGQTLHVVIC